MNNKVNVIILQKHRSLKNFEKTRKDDFKRSPSWLTLRKKTLVNENNPERYRTGGGHLSPPRCAPGASASPGRFTAGVS